MENLTLIGKGQGEQRPILIRPNPLCLDKVDTVLFFVGGTFVRIEFKLHVVK